MYCIKRLIDVTNQECLQCWKSGQKAAWRKRMVEDYGYNPGNGHTAYLLRRDCRLNYLTNKPPQQHLTKGDICDAD